jgi:hypothetical protein
VPWCLVSLRRCRCERSACGGVLNEEAQRNGRLAALFLVGCAWFNAPLLRVASVPDHWRGVPVAWVYLFSTWALFILLTAWLSRGGRAGEPRPAGGAGTAADPRRGERAPVDELRED